MIDPHAELTPGLRAWYDRSKPTLSEIGVWIPVVLYLALFGVISFPMLRENPPGTVFQNVQRLRVPLLLPIYCVIMHFVGAGILGYGALKRELGTHVRATLTGYGLLTAILSSSGYMRFIGKGVEISEERMVMIWTNAVFSLVWVVLAVWKIRIALDEGKTA